MATPQKGGKSPGDGQRRFKKGRVKQAQRTEEEAERRGTYPLLEVILDIILISFGIMIYVVPMKIST